MNSAKNLLLDLIEKIPEDKIVEVIDFIGYLKLKNEMEFFKDLEKASNSSTDFWNNEIDDEVWDDV